MLTNHFCPLSKPVIPMICEYKDTKILRISVLHLVFLFYYPYFTEPVFGSVRPFIHGCAGISKSITVSPLTIQVHPNRNICFFLCIIIEKAAVYI